MSRRVIHLHDRSGHIVAMVPHVCRFGSGLRPVCTEELCGYVGPIVNRARAIEMAFEHRRKSAGTWRPAW